jgi:hypothetical protein
MERSMALFAETPLSVPIANAFAATPSAHSHPTPGTKAVVWIDQ